MKNLKHLLMLISITFFTPVFAQTNYINGQLDSTFGINGSVTTDLYGLEIYDLIAGAKTGPDGKYYIGGAHGEPGNFTMFITRYYPNGTLDSTYGNNGVLQISPLISNVAYIQAIDIQPDGKVVGVGFTTAADRELAIVRITTDGMLDTSFNHTGVYVTGYPNSDDAWNDVLVQTDGQIIAVGYIYGNSGGNQIAMRLNADGTLDETFGNFGLVTFDYGGSEQFLDILQHASNRYYVIGYNAGRQEIYALNGSGDKVLTFGNNGAIEIEPIGNKYPTIYNIQTTNDGKIWLCGTVQYSGAFDSYFARLQSNGDFDSTFSGDGIFIEDMSPGEIDRFSDFEIQDDGSLFLVGHYHRSGYDTSYLYTTMLNPQGYVDINYGYLGANIYPINGVSGYTELNRDLNGDLWVAAGLDGASYDFIIVKFKTDNPTGIIENRSINFGELSVYPNPIASSTIELTLNDPQTLSVLIIDAYGRILETIMENRQMEVGTHLIALKADKLSAGIYYCLAGNGQEWMINRIVKID